MVVASSTNYLSYRSHLIIIRPVVVQSETRTVQAVGYNARGYQWRANFLHSRKEGKKFRIIRSWSTIASKINVTPKGVYLPISKLNSILAVANLPIITFFIFFFLPKWIFFFFFFFFLLLTNCITRWCSYIYIIYIYISAVFLTIWHLWG